MLTQEYKEKKKDKKNDKDTGPFFPPSLFSSPFLNVNNLFLDQSTDFVYPKSCSCPTQLKQGFDDENKDEQLFLNLFIA